ncbi:type 1 glutamine amidotransferase [Tropicimonas marinistellae]|uniref:type 1 glutamine amidotransferase n=1 Tax=Tropicimonas marinistellae TaxID=1739787 RepID=UPI00082AE1B1|nr:type 1 glutamine amidotransferase [Tropicimonas marinistellae]
MLIGILQTGTAPEELKESTGDYPGMFEQLLAGNGFTFRTWNVEEGDIPAGADAAEGWLITGSKHGVYESHPWIAPLENLIRQIYVDGRPLVGICFGHQIIAQALGGRVEKFSGGWSVGRTIYDFDGTELALNAWHQDQVIEPPLGAETVASSATCRHAALLYDTRIYTTQAHPEFDAEFLAGLIRTRGKVLPQSNLDKAIASLPMPTDNAEIARRMAQFLLGGTASH